MDGVAGPRTRRALGRRGRPALGSRPLKQGTRGWDVAALQFLLARHGFPSGPVDGGLGARTEAALARFQMWAGLAVDAVAGPATVAALRRPPPRSLLRFAWPLRAPVGDRFGPRGARFHSGIDLPAPSGAPVAAAGYGCVESAGWNAGGYGNLVVIRHRLGMTSWYAHLRGIAVRAGTCLRRRRPDRDRRLHGRLHRPAPALRAAPARRGGQPAQRPRLADVPADLLNT